MRKDNGQPGAVRKVASAARTQLRRRTKRVLGQLTTVRLGLDNAHARTPVTGSAPVMVSLTSYGRRVESVWATIESIAAGSVRPQRLVLWLDDQELFDHPPVTLQRLQARGLEIALTENLGPHTKYFPALEEIVCLGWPLVTADDDVLYPRYWLRRLLQAHTERPEEVHCYRANEITLDADGIRPYAQWPRCRSTGTSPRYFATGVSGVIYPTKMTAALHRLGDGFRTTSLQADDVWLHWVALREGVAVRQLSRTPRHFPIFAGSQATTLNAGNVAGGGNDRYIEALYDSLDVQRLRLDSTA